MDHSSSFQLILDRLVAAHGDVEISPVQVFAELDELEPATSSLLPFLQMKHFFPRKFTITIRHRKLLRSLFTCSHHVPGAG